MHSVTSSSTGLTSLLDQSKSTGANVTLKSKVLSILRVEYTQVLNMVNINFH